MEETTNDYTGEIEEFEQHVNDMNLDEEEEVEEEEEEIEEIIEDINPVLLILDHAKQLETKPKDEILNYFIDRQFCNDCNNNIQFFAMLTGPVGTILFRFCHFVKLVNRNVYALKELDASILDIEKKIENQLNEIDNTDSDLSESSKEHLINAEIPIRYNEIDELKIIKGRFKSKLNELVESSGVIINNVINTVERALEPAAIRLTDKGFNQLLTVEIEKPKNDCNCPICLEKITENYSKINICNHMGCTDCLHKYFTEKCQRVLCPLCRTDVRGEDNSNDLTVITESLESNNITQVYNNLLPVHNTTNLINIVNSLNIPAARIVPPSEINEINDIPLNQIVQTHSRHINDPPSPPPYNPVTVRPRLSTALNSITRNLIEPLLPSTASPPITPPTQRIRRRSMPPPLPRQSFSESTIPIPHREAYSWEGTTTTSAATILYRNALNQNTRIFTLRNNDDSTEL